MMVASSGHQAHLNGDNVSTYDQGMCQKFVRDACWKAPSLYGSAIDAWNGSTQKHKGDRDAPEGAPMYYSGGNYGHAVCGQDANSRRMRSTDSPSAGKVSDQDISWVEQHWGYTYLGWTGDINGVDLPLGDSGGSSGSSSGEDDDMQTSDKITEWSPDEGTSKEDTTVGKTLNQARGYSEDTYDRMKKLQDKVNALDDKVDKILNAVT
jgi:hypothetical protein